MSTFQTELGEQVVSNRRALEALRSGVPNRQAVKILGANQPRLEARFQELLERTGEANEPLTEGLGMTVSGRFGEGKSHILQYFENEALSNQFVCSRISINKQMPLSNLGNIFRGAIESAQIPNGQSGLFMEELTVRLDFKTPEFVKFFQWANQEAASNGLSQIFPASVTVFERSRDTSLQQEIQDFWSGHPISASIINKGLSSVGARQAYSYKAPKKPDLPPQQFRFTLELIKAAGYKGWVILLDEVEMVGSYSRLGRGKSYANLALLMGAAPDAQYPGLISVAAITQDYYQAKIETDDIHETPMYLRGKADDATAARATAGMHLLNNQSRIEIAELTDEDVESTIEKLRQVYTDAYNWPAPNLEENLEGAGNVGRRIRSRVRTAVNSWDLMRLNPGTLPHMQTEDTYRPTYDEDPDMETTTAE